MIATDGFRFGVGFEISLVCDFRIAAEAAKSALPEQLGQRSPARAAPRTCTHRRHRAYQRTSSYVRAVISARQALDWGIATEIVSDGKFESAADRWLASGRVCPLPSAHRRSC
jgi:2-oxoglutaroyl-CoA hydrolase